MIAAGTFFSFFFFCNNSLCSCSMYSLAFVLVEVRLYLLLFYWIIKFYRKIKAVYRLHLMTCWLVNVMDCDMIVVFIS